MAAPVPPIGELVEISLQVLPADAVVGSERPPFEVRKDAMNPRQEHMCCHRTDDLGLVVVILEAAV